MTVQSPSGSYWFMGTKNKSQHMLQHGNQHILKAPVLALCGPLLKNNVIVIKTFQLQFQPEKGLRCKESESFPLPVLARKDVGFDYRKTRGMNLPRKIDSGCWFLERKMSHGSTGKKNSIKKAKVCLKAELQTPA